MDEPARDPAYENARTLAACAWITLLMMLVAIGVAATKSVHFTFLVPFAVTATVGFAATAEVRAIQLRPPRSRPAASP